MKNYSYIILIAFALMIAFSAHFARKAQAQTTGGDMMGGTMDNGAGAQTNNLEGTPTFVKEIVPGYRDWRLVSVAHEAGNLNDIRAILGNDAAIDAYRQGTLPFPDGSIIARIAWLYVPSDENNKVFGRQQSFVPGAQPSWYLQFMIKDSKKYAATGGWGYGQFDKDGIPAPVAMMTSCYPCHQAVKARDFVFTHYAP